MATLAQTREGERIKNITPLEKLIRTQNWTEVAACKVMGRNANTGSEAIVQHQNAVQNKSIMAMGQITRMQSGSSEATNAHLRKYSTKGDTKATHYDAKVNEMFVCTCIWNRLKSNVQYSTWTNTHREPTNVQTHTKPMHYGTKTQTKHVFFVCLPLFSTRPAQQ